MFNTTTLFASLLWGAVGTGYFVYGKRQHSWVPMLAGVLMIGASYFTSSPWVLTLICVALIAAVHMLLKRGY